MLRLPWIVHQQHIWFAASNFLAVGEAMLVKQAVSLARCFHEEDGNYRRSLSTGDTGPISALTPPPPTPRPHKPGELRMLQGVISKGDRGCTGFSCEHRVAPC